MDKRLWNVTFTGGKCYFVILANNMDIEFRYIGGPREEAEFPLNSGVMVPLQQLLGFGILGAWERMCPDKKAPPEAPAE